MTFTELRDVLDMTDGNLSVHLNKLVEALKTLGGLPRDFPVDRLFLAGVTQTAD